jgi:hypothetical protein
MNWNPVYCVQVDWISHFSLSFRDLGTLTLNLFGTWFVHLIFKFSVLAGRILPLSRKLIVEVQWSTEQNTINNIDIMYHRTTKQWANMDTCHNALNASNHQAFEILQAVLLYNFVQQYHAH